MNQSTGTPPLHRITGEVKKKIPSLIAIIFIIAVIVISPTNAQEVPAKKVLVLLSYHEGDVWTDTLLQGIESIFRNNEEVTLYVEYMDSSRINEKGYSQKLYEFYRSKYMNHRFDAVISSDDEAFNFLVKRQKDLFPETPWIFCGVNYYNGTALDTVNYHTGVVETLDIRGTLDIALSLHPGTQRVVVINDQSVTGLQNKRLLEETIPEYGERVEFTFFEGMNMSEVQKAVETLPENTIILFMTFNRDKSGNYFENEESLERIARNSPVPVYGVWETYLGRGIVGGKLTSGFHQGRQAAELTSRILNGESATEIPVVTDVPSRSMFDYTQMQRFNIGSSILPEGSTIINEPAQIVLDIRIYWGGIIGIAGLSCIIILLNVNISRRKKVEKALRESQKKYKELSKLQHEALAQIEQNLEQMAILNDHIRNPLTVIVALADLEEGETRDNILQQAKAIDRIIQKLDLGWLESLKIRDYLRRYHSYREE